jgi:hypothetical protein
MKTNLMKISAIVALSATLGACVVAPPQPYGYRMTSTVLPTYVNGQYVGMQPSDYVAPAQTTVTTPAQPVAAATTQPAPAPAHATTVATTQPAPVYLQATTPSVVYVQAPAQPVYYNSYYANPYPYYAPYPYYGGPYFGGYPWCCGVGIGIGIGFRGRIR